MSAIEQCLLNILFLLSPCTCFATNRLTKTQFYCIQNCIQNCPKNKIQERKSVDKKLSLLVCYGFKNNLFIIE